MNTAQLLNSCSRRNCAWDQICTGFPSLLAGNRWNWAFGFLRQFVRNIIGGGARTRQQPPSCEQETARTAWPAGQCWRASASRAGCTRGTLRRGGLARRDGISRAHSTRRLFAADRTQTRLSICRGMAVPHYGSRRSAEMALSTVQGHAATVGAGWRDCHGADWLWNKPHPEVAKAAEEEISLHAALDEGYSLKPELYRLDGRKMRRTPPGPSAASQHRTWEAG